MPVEIEQRPKTGTDTIFKRKTYDVSLGAETEGHILQPLGYISAYPDYFAVSFNSNPDVALFEGIATTLISQTREKGLDTIEKDVGGYYALADGSNGTFDIDQPISDVLVSHPDITNLRLNTPWMDIWFRYKEEKVFACSGMMSHLPLFEEATKLVTSMAPTNINLQSEDKLKLKTRIQELIAYLPSQPVGILP